MNWLPREYQLDPVRLIAEALNDHRSILDGSDTGVGKTLHTLFALRETVGTVGVVCPKSVVPHWEELAAEIEVDLEWVWNIEKLKNRKDIVHRSPKGRAWSWVKPPDVLVVDEVHRFGAPDTQNARILACFPGPVVMLSATAAEDPRKMRAIGSKLGLTTWRDWWTWCGRNGCTSGRFGGMEFNGGPDVLDRLHKQIYATGRGVRVRRADVAGFPRGTTDTRSVPVVGVEALNKAYKEELEAKEADAENALVATIHASQLAEHAMLPGLIEMLEDSLTNGQAPVVFVNFKESLEQLRMRFADGAIIEGGQTGEERARQVRRFRDRKARVALVMIQAGGTGLDGLQDSLGDAPRESFIFPGWSARELIQALGRLVRANTASPVMQHILYAADSLGQRKRRKVERKIRNIETLNDGDMEL